MGLDIIMGKMRRPRDLDLTKVYTKNDLQNLFGDDGGYEIRNIPVEKGFPADFMFRYAMPTLDLGKVLEFKSTPEHPRSWSDGGWQVSGEGTDIWDPSFKDEEVPGCSHYITLSRYDGEGDYAEQLDSVVFAATEENVKRCTTVSERWCCAMESGELAYMCEGLSKKFWKDMDGGRSPWLFTKADMEYALENWFREQYKYEFKQEFVDRFEDGNGLYVWFWY